jgi:murein DD-endopeptidase / murein LD-carboxypeptidase
MPIDYAARARALVGTRFRAQGRGEGGLDCVGVVIATFGIPADAVRRDYRLRGNDVHEVVQALAGFFRAVAQEHAGDGDLMLMQPARDQLHFGVRIDKGFVHADARLRRVVETPGMPAWPVLGIYRKLGSS